MGCDITATRSKACGPSRQRNNMSASFRFALVAALLAASLTGHADDGDRLLTIDHYVRVTSTVPAMAGQPAQLYVRERVLAGGRVDRPYPVMSTENVSNPACAR